MWWAAIPREHWDFPEGKSPDLLPRWDERYGDRAQELVFIGQKMDEAGLRARLDACLLDEQLAKEDSKAWAQLANPFRSSSSGSRSEARTGDSSNSDHRCLTESP